MVALHKDRFWRNFSFQQDLLQILNVGYTGCQYGRPSDCSPHKGANLQLPFAPCACSGDARGLDDLYERDPCISSMLSNSTFAAASLSGGRRRVGAWDRGAFRGDKIFYLVLDQMME